jgi:hypothetical protein
MRYSDWPRNHSERVFTAAATNNRSYIKAAFTLGRAEGTRDKLISRKEQTMKLVVPYVDTPLAADDRLIRLAQFVGITCEQLPLTRSTTDYAGFFESTKIARDSCFVVNPDVMREWLKADTFPSELGPILSEYFNYCLVHALRVDRFHSKVVATLSGGSLQAVQTPQQANTSYDIALDSRDICEAFAGLSFGPINPANDKVFVADDVPSLRRFISIGSDVFMAAVKRDNAEILFVGSGDVAELTAKVNEANPIEYFSRLVPFVMAFRHVFGEECWRPVEQHASVVIDDPLLKPDYGFLNFDALLKLTKKHEFQTTIAFIPHNSRRSSRRITKMFLENTDRLALCFHGNDHGNAEFATTNRVSLNTMLETAERRMTIHKEVTGLTCDRVMVFPQGQFSLEAMSVLKDRNYDAAVNTVPHPKQQRVDLALGDLAAPAVCCYDRFPLFLRKDSLHTNSVDIAWNLFFGRPLFIVEHHGIFRDPRHLIDAVNRINELAHGVRWSNVGTAVRNSILSRRGADGRCQIRAYSRTIQVSNRSEARDRFLIEWDNITHPEAVEAVLRDGVPCDDFRIDKFRITVTADIDPGMSEEFSVVYRNNQAAVARGSLWIMARAFIRRRLSEIRDNYISKSPALLGLTKSVQRRLQH